MSKTPSIGSPGSPSFEDSGATGLILGCTGGSAVRVAVGKGAFVAASCATGLTVWTAVAEGVMAGVGCPGGAGVLAGVGCRVGVEIGVSVVRRASTGEADAVGVAVQTDTRNEGEDGVSVGVGEVCKVGPDVWLGVGEGWLDEVGTGVGVAGAGEIGWEIWLGVGVCVGVAEA